MLHITLKGAVNADTVIPSLLRAFRSFDPTTSYDGVRRCILVPKAQQSDVVAILDQALPGQYVLVEVTDAQPALGAWVHD